MQNERSLPWRRDLHNVIVQQRRFEVAPSIVTVERRPQDHVARLVVDTFERQTLSRTMRIWVLHDHVLARLDVRDHIIDIFVEDDSVFEIADVWLERLPHTRGRQLSESNCSDAIALALWDLERWRNEILRFFFLLFFVHEEPPDIMVTHCLP